MKYRGYLGQITFDDQADVFRGEVMNCRDVITFQGESVVELKSAFEKSVDDYLLFCAERGEPPDKPFSGQFLVRMSPDLHRKVDLAARMSGNSLNAWVSAQLQSAVDSLKFDLPNPDETEAEMQKQNDYSKRDLWIGEQLYEKRVAKRRAVFLIVKILCKSGETPNSIEHAVPRLRKPFRHVDGDVNSEEFIRQQRSSGKPFDPRKHWCSDRELIKANGKTYALTDQWGIPAKEAIDELLTAFRHKKIRCVVATD